MTAVLRKHDTTYLHLYSVIVIVQQEDSIPSHLLCLHHSLEVCQETHVLGHVCGQDHIYHHLPETTPLLDCQTLEDVTVLLLKSLECCGKVVVLQDTLVIVGEGKVVAGGHQVLVGEAWVAHIMYTGS